MITLLWLRRALAAALPLAGLLTPVSGASDPATGAYRRFADSIVAVPISAPGSRPHLGRENLTAAELAEQLDFSVSLQMRDFDGLEARIASGQKIAQAEMEANYLPSKTDYDRVAAWLQSRGFGVTLKDRNHTNVFVRGTVARISQALDVRFARVVTAAGEFTSAITAPGLPPEISGVVLSVNGLQPQLRARHPQHRATPLAGLGGLAGAPTPADIAYAYNLPPALNGAGETIGVICDAVPARSDLTEFWSLCGINQSINNFTVIDLAGGPAPNGDLAESTLDVEWASGLAPAAGIRYYALPNLQYSNFIFAATQILFDLVQYPGLHQVSLSIGGPENEAGNSGTLKSYSQTFAQLAAAGVSVFVSSGDGGSNPDPNLSVLAYGAAFPLTAYYPASDPNVSGVGGTTLSFSAYWMPTGETTWFVSDPNYYANTVGTGGGLSAVFSRPAWQTGAGVPALNARCVPDVAAQADSGFVFIDGQSAAYFGTSLSAPIWAGLTAILNQGRAGYSLPPLGLLGPWIYRLIGTSAFQDITTGSNGAYSAGPGYDLCTGVGTPNVTNLLAQIDEEISSSGPPSNPVNLGATVTMSATPQLAATYQWQLGSVDIPGATSSSYTILSATGANSGAYFVRITSALGTFTYSIGTLIVNAPPAIAVQPYPQTVNLGGSASLAVTATGAGPISYQWQFNGANMSGATGAGLNLTNLQSAGGGSYAVVVTNPFGSTTSAVAAIAVVGGPGAPALATQPVSEAIASGSTVTFSALGTSSSQAPCTYQWQFDGTPIAGATGSRLVVSGATAANAGIYTCLVTSSGVATVSGAAQLTIAATANPGRLGNISVLSNFLAGQTLTVGFVTGGAGTAGAQPVLIRATGPSLAAATGLPGTMADPQLALIPLGQASAIAANDNWGTPASNAALVTAADAATYAFPLTAGSLDAALVDSLAPGGYSVQVSGSGPGTALTEVYDDTPASAYTAASPRLVNVSCNDQIAFGGSLTVGFTIGGTTAKTVLIRASGPTLRASFSVGGAMADPQVLVYSSAQILLASDQAWGGDPQITAAAASVSAFSFASATSLDSAVPMTLAPGSYTAVVSSRSGGAASRWRRSTKSPDPEVGRPRIQWPAAASADPGSRRRYQPMPSARSSGRCGAPPA